MFNFSKSKNSIGIIILVALSFAGGIYIGLNQHPEVDKVAELLNKETGVETKADFAPFWKAWNVINDKYPKANMIADQDRVYGAISGLVGSLNDPYSVFFDPIDTQAFEEEIAGNFTGVGMEVGMKDKILTVVAPLKDTPAYKADIRPGDKIIKIDATVTTRLSMEEAIKLIRGEKGTTVLLTILRENSIDPIEKKVIRDVINIPTIDTELREDGIFIIRLYSFSANATNLFRDAMREFVTTNTDKLILDLRGNPGGYLDAAVDISSWFLPGGKVIVIEDYGGKKDPEIFRSRGYNLFNNNLKFIILINGGSASASEIVAGAMQDHGRAKLVGNRSFGKGSVQEAIKMPNDTLLKITVAKWLTPNENLIEEMGLTPDYEVEIRQKDVENKRDPQLDKAVELLLSN